MSMPKATSITIPRGGQEYVHWDLSGLLEPPNPDNIEVSIDGGNSWHAATVDGFKVSVLVAHPSFANPHASAITAPAGSSEMYVRLTDSPEVVVRYGGRLTIG